MDAVALHRALTPCYVCGGRNAGKCRRRRCSEGVERWSKDTWSVLAAALVDVPMVLMVVITAPGADVLPWDTRKCLVAYRHSCSGPLGCRVDARARRRWEDDIQHRWCLLRQAVVMRLKRQGYRSPLIAFGDEDQLRGAWHRNLILTGGPASWAFVRHLHELAPTYGFGFSDRKVEPRTGVSAAGYVAGYIAGKGSKKDGANIQTIAQRSPTRRKVWWVSSRLTMQTGVTMGSLRTGRSVWAFRQGYRPMPTTGLAVIDWQVIDCETGAVMRQVWTREGGDMHDDEIEEAFRLAPT
jgi:hypothetical protein